MTRAVAGPEFVWPVRVYWEDTDAGGVVYYANYLRFMERARTEWLRALGVEQSMLKEHLNVLMVVAQVTANYRRPARYGEQLQVHCRLAAIGKVSLSFEQRIYRDAVGGELLLDGMVKVGCIDAASFRPRALPQEVVRSLQA